MTELNYKDNKSFHIRRKILKSGEVIKNLVD